LVLSYLEHSEQAIEAYDKAIEINSQHLDAWCEKARSLCYLKRYEEAIEAYDKALEIGPQSEIILAEKNDIESLLRSNA
jgi:tetratricopeptide (TPR) repeat protein